MGKTSYLVLALGVLLSLCGAVAIATGYGIIQVERGWAGVIAGATALSGGIVTIALGFILRGLSGMHALLKTGRALTPLPRGLGEDAEPGLAFNPEAFVAPEAGPAPAAMPAAASSRSRPQRPARPTFAPARNLLKSRGTALPAARETPESDFALPAGPPLSHAPPKVSHAANEPPPEPRAGVAGGAAPANSAPLPEAASQREWNEESEPGLFDGDTEGDRTFDAQLEETPYGQGEPGIESGPGVTWPAEMAPIDATTGEDHRIEPDTAPDAWHADEKPSPEAIEPSNLTPAPPLESEAPPEAEPRERSSASGAGLSIVGRYESEGTSYIMYGDGSIEARTQHAVLHFRSMAELKTFMDSQAQRPQD
ncbi:MAG: hypothetical protein ACT4O2_15125 [Beijerinckiaceae bacterium]